MTRTCPDVCYFWSALEYLNSMAAFGQGDCDCEACQARANHYYMLRSDQRWRSEWAGNEKNTISKKFRGSREVSRDV
jgi:hypothetical protein